MPTMGNSCLIAFTALLLPIAAACAESPDPLAGEAEEQLRPVIEELAKRPDADSQAAAGLLSVFGRREEVLPLLAKATFTAPERADLLWLHIQYCVEDASCDPEPLERRLRRLDGKNGAGWLGALARAATRGDEEAKSAALASIGRSERVDTYWTTLNSRLSRQVASAITPPIRDPEAIVVGALAAVVVPGYSYAIRACKGESLARQEVVEVCRGVANAFLHGDAVITEGIGISIAKQAWPENSPKWVEVVEARRILDYRMQLSNKWVDANLGEYLALFAQHRREQDVMKAVLLRNGVDPNPPPGWTRTPP